jgi:pimeloyl-ACP methyl ester carboxylesterase
VASPAPGARVNGPQRAGAGSPGFGDSPPDLPGTLERQVEVVERFRERTGLDRVVLVVHGTGGVIGLRWACEHPDAVSGMVISNTGFFPDVEWVAIAKTIRTPIQGEALVDSLSREGFATMLEATSADSPGSSLFISLRVIAVPKPGTEGESSCVIALTEESPPSTGAAPVLAGIASAHTPRARARTQLSPPRCFVVVVV